MAAFFVDSMIVPTLCAHRYTQVLLEEYDDDRSYALGTISVRADS